MKRLFVFLLIMTIASRTLAQADSGLHEAESAIDFAYTGLGWLQIVDNDYVVMESSVLDDSASLEFVGSSVVIYRELLPLIDNPATIEICLDSICTSISNLATENQKRVPISFATSGASPHNLTLTNLDGGVFRLDYVLVMPNEELQTINSPSPSLHYFTLESGRVVSVDFSISGGDITLSIFLAFLSSLTMYKIVMDRWHHG